VDDVHVRGGDQSRTGARSLSLFARFPARIPIEVPMRRIGLAVILVVSTIFTPLAV
jgi:hypothetical protein